MDIRTGIIASAIMAALAAIVLLRGGLRSIQASRKLTFFRLRRQRMGAGWRMLGASLFFLLLGGWLVFYGEPVAYQYFPPSPTPSLTPSITLVPTITLSPTITLTPTITDTPSITDTPTITPTPYIPPAIEVLFGGIVTPNPDAAFSPLQFSTVYENFECVAPSTSFVNPIRSMTACYSYNNMLPGTQYTELWYRNGGLVNYDTHVWGEKAGEGTGGLGYAQWQPPPEMWLPGRYEVHIFVGMEWKVVGQFLVSGEPPTSTPSVTPSPRMAPTFTHTPSVTPSPSQTPMPTLTP